MTGFGQANKDGNQFSLQAEVKSLNSKFLDLNLRFPKSLSEKELEIRNLITEKLERGKVTVSIEIQKSASQLAQVQFNQELFKVYYQSLKNLSETVGEKQTDLFSIALNLPEVVQSNIANQVNEEEWLMCKEVLTDAISKCDAFRQDEGKVLHKKFVEYIQNIQQSVLKVKELDPKRIEKIRERLKGNITSFFGEENYDKNRLEQEIIFYIEKLDIQEEIVRLTTHLNYFIQVLNEKNSNGKKLNFIAQEIGREINTIGSKSNDADMQKEVVLMKEELEKIKEQLNNIL